MGVADERDAARHAAGGRWGELYAKGDGLPGRKGEGETQPADAEARSSNNSLRNGQVDATGVGQGEVLQAAAADHYIAEAGVGGRDGELRLHAVGTEGDGAGRIGGVADERDAARCAAGGRWCELHAKGAGLPGCKGEGGGQPADAEARSSNIEWCGGHLDLPAFAPRRSSDLAAADHYIAEAGVGGRDGELRLHAGAAEGDGTRRIGGVADEREAARHAAGGRWGELYAKGDGLPGRKVGREWWRGGG